jgi:hypothetical protein
LAPNEPGLAAPNEAAFAAESASATGFRAGIAVPNKPVVAGAAADFATGFAALLPASGAFPFCDLPFVFATAGP